MQPFPQYYLRFYLNKLGRLGNRLATIGPIRWKLCFHDYFQMHRQLVHSLQLQAHPYYRGLFLRHCHRLPLHLQLRIESVNQNDF